MERSDQHLLRAIAAGDRGAFAAFYDRHAPRVFGALLQWLRQRADAEDVLQEIFWQVWRRAGQYDASRSPPEAWLFLLARSRALDHLRRQRDDTGALPVAEPALVHDPTNVLEREETNVRLRAALAQLPDEQRSAIALAFFGGLTYEQVARRQAIPLGTAKTRIRLGMKRLRDLLG